MKFKTLLAAAAVSAMAFSAPGFAASGNIGSSGNSGTGGTNVDNGGFFGSVGNACGSGNSGSGGCGTNVDNMGFEASGNKIYVRSIHGQDIKEIIARLKAEGGVGGGLLGQAIRQAARDKGFKIE